ncbi:Transcriptional regulator [Candidatus Terasakiella magnetica]|uniref:Transcriptional regulator n=1 Tax=Candidatus Terasakiella magnetica TaxID=1867952 RepID=A0A1C3RJY0_9PROT|nr:FadR/GntR family transcriptional regulator [Candidatus Terasakiella magnetica]SCA57537.1 Transcriptional regulator [Candidatus Terasakiella magnetica]
MDEKTGSGTKAKAGLLSDRVAARIMTMIADGNLSPGERLPGERQLAEKMGVSRVSVRAALQSLKAQGFLEAVQGGGTRILAAAGDMTSPLGELAKVKEQNLHDLAEIRALLEVWAARRAAERASDEQISELTNALEKQEQQKGSAAAKAKASQEFNFHYMVGKASGSAVYMHIMDVIRDIIDESIEFHQYDLFQEPAEDGLALAQHKDVLEAIKSRDGLAAKVAMRSHLSWVLDSYENERERLNSETKSEGLPGE